MAKVIIEGLTKEQATTFAEWYEGQGEQDADAWFDNASVPTPITDVHREGGYMKVDDDTVTIYCRS